MRLQDKHTNDVVEEMYKNAEGHETYGVYFFGIPALTIRDPEIIRQILVKDFDHFADRQPNFVNNVSSSKTDQVKKHTQHSKLKTLKL